MADAIPALPPGFKLDPVPDLPPGFKLDPVGEETPPKVQTKMQPTVMGRIKAGEPVFPKAAEKIQDVAGKVAPYTSWLPSAESLMVGAPGEGLAAGVSAVGKRALGLAAGVGAGFGVKEGLEYFGVNPYVADALGTAAGAAVGGKLGMSAEHVEMLKEAGPFGFIRRLLKGPSSREDAADFFRLVRGKAPEGPEKVQAANYWKELQRIHKEGGDEAAGKFIEELKSGPWKGTPPKPEKPKLMSKDKPVKLKDAPFHGPHEPVPPALSRPLTFDPDVTTPIQPEVIPEEKPVKLASTPYHGPHQPIPSASSRPVEVKPFKTTAEKIADVKNAEVLAKKAAGAGKASKVTPDAPTGITPMGKVKLRGDIFANVDQLAEKAGANKTNFKKVFRTTVEQKYGKGISEMSENELMEVANGIQELLGR